jgi:hypothetical protein
VKDILLGQEYMRYQSELDAQIGVMESRATTDETASPSPHEDQLEAANNAFRSALPSERWSDYSALTLAQQKYYLAKLVPKKGEIVAQSGEELSTTAEVLLKLLKEEVVDPHSVTMPLDLSLPSTSSIYYGGGVFPTESQRQ